MGGSLIGYRIELVEGLLSHRLVFLVGSFVHFVYFCHYIVLVFDEFGTGNLRLGCDDCIRAEFLSWYRTFADKRRHIVGFSVLKGYQ